MFFFFLQKDLSKREKLTTISVFFCVISRRDHSFGISSDANENWIKDLPLNCRFAYFSSKFIIAKKYWFWHISFRLISDRFTIYNTGQAWHNIYGKSSMQHLRNDCASTSRLAGAWFSLYCLCNSWQALDIVILPSSTLIFFVRLYCSIDFAATGMKVPNSKKIVSFSTEN